MWAHDAFTLTEAAPLEDINAARRGLAWLDAAGEIHPDLYDDALDHLNTVERDILIRNACL